MVTIREIAQAVGVSSATVSRVLNADATLSVTPQTRQKIIETAEALNYVTPRNRNRTAGALLKKIAFVHFLEPAQELRDPYYVALRLGIERRCRELQVETVKVYHTDRLPEPTLLQSVSGVIAIGPQSSGWTNYTGAFTSGKVAATTIGVWITGTLKANKDQSGKWGVAPVPKLAGVTGATHATNLGGSSWYVLASSSHKDPALDFLNQVWGKDADFYQKILVDQGAVGSLLAARQGKTYEAADPFFGGEKVWQNFSTWLGQVPGVNYGVYTNEVDAAVIAQLPGLAKGGSIDDAIKAIDAQVATQIQ